MGRAESSRRVKVVGENQPSNPHPHTPSPIPPVRRASHAAGYKISNTYGSDDNTVAPIGPVDQGDGTSLLVLEPDDSGSYPGFPTISECEASQESYVKNLPPNKRAKALITQDMYDYILAVLMDPFESSKTTPQFRYWVRKTFTLAISQGEHTVTRKGAPVAVREQIYQILVYCHAEIGHAGRDRTRSHIEQHYSYIPRVLIAEFIKGCPTCAPKNRGPRKFIAGLNDTRGGTVTNDKEDVDEHIERPMFVASNPHQKRPLKTILPKPRPPPGVLVDSSNTRSNSNPQSYFSTPSFALCTPNAFGDDNHGFQQPLHNPSMGKVSDLRSTLLSDVDSPPPARWNLGIGLSGYGPSTSVDANTRLGGTRGIQAQPKHDFMRRDHSYRSQNRPSDATSSRSGGLEAPLAPPRHEAHCQTFGKPHPDAPPRFHPSLTSEIRSPEFCQRTSAGFFGAESATIVRREELDISLEGDLLVANSLDSDGYVGMRGHQTSDYHEFEVKVEEDEGVSFPSVY